ncbi:putative phosphoglycerate mutase [Tamaricihabitans halophyticus]|uniref:Putative phosphoglycerate mutase n=1 Tax=Tamaricihabitans halophyticus TaxID=1262583 RepID=A0A4V2SV51_9PSEU|nr:histidine phosphatase family protein [Tamaricihabitans halophyticus]TCP57116.1 putative phosphoglycerate mutase [Tamaricihabitans halophyticus]
MTDDAPPRLELARHGETVWHAENRYAGSSDVALTERGRSQAEQLGRWAAGQPITQVLCSPLSRAARTAEPAALSLGLPLRTDARLVEVDFGDAEGITRAEMAERFPDELSDWLAAPAARALPGGERGVAALDRVWPLITELAARPGTTLVVAHGTLLRLVLCRLFDLPLDAYRRLFPSLRNTALTTVEFRAEGPALLGLNVPPHAP